MFLTCVAQLRKWFTGPHPKSLDGQNETNFLARPFLESSVFFSDVHREIVDHFLVRSSLTIFATGLMLVQLESVLGSHEGVYDCVRWLITPREADWLSTIVPELSGLPGPIREVVTWWPLYQACHPVLFVKPDPEVYHRDFSVRENIPYHIREYGPR